MFEPTLFESEAPQFDATKARTKGKIFILDQDQTQDGHINIDDLKWQYYELYYLQGGISANQGQ